MARGREQVVLARRLDTGDWVVVSAADAPGDSARIEALVERLRRLSGPPLAEAPSSSEPLEIRLADREGRVLGHAGFLAGAAQARDPAGRPQGPWVALARTPALPLWPSAWSSLRPPRIAATDVARVERITADGRQPLAGSEAARVALKLERLGAVGFVAAATVNRAGAERYRVTLADGQAIDVETVPDGEGGVRLRLTSDTLPEVRAARVYAFRLPEPLA
ncbi:MAG: hypothetical protein ACK4Z0_08065 [Sphingomonadaceae bacterium]